MESIFFIGLVLVGYHLGGKIGKLENRVRRLEGQVENNPVSWQGQVPGDLAPRPIPSPDAQYQPVSMEQVLDQIDRTQATDAPNASGFIEWVTKDFMVKLGALLLLLAAGWFVSYAIMAQWIGPAGQIALGLLFGVVLLGVGVWRIQEYRHQGGIFTVLGATVVLLTLLAARLIYGFFTPASVLIAMFLTVGFVAFVSIRFKSEKLAYSGLVMASIAPYFTAAMPMSALELFTYLLVVIAGTLWLVWMTGWTRLTLLSLIITYLYSIGYISIIGGSTPEEDITLMFSFLFVSLYFAANMVSLVRRHGQEAYHMPVHTLTALGIAIYLLTWIETAIDPEWKSLLYAAWAVVFALGTYVVYKFTANRSAFYLYGATSAALIGVATAAELDGPVLTLAFLFEVCLILAVAGKLGMARETMMRISWLLAVPLFLSLESLNPWAWGENIFNEHFVVVTLTMMVLFSVAFIFKLKEGKEATREAHLTSQVFDVLGGMYAVSLVWLVTHSMLPDDMATMLSLIIYTIAGIFFYTTGTREGDTAFRVAGGVLVGIVVLRLLIFEVWNMDLGGRIITFLIIGGMLISTAFIKKSQNIEQ